MVLAEAGDEIGDGGRPPGVTLFALRIAALVDRNAQLDRPLARPLGLPDRPASDRISPFNPLPADGVVEHPFPVLAAEAEPGDAALAVIDDVGQAGAVLEDIAH